MSVPSSLPGVDTAPAKYPLGAMCVLLLGLFAMYVPTFQRLAAMVWSTDEQGHGPLILAASLWLLWGKRQALFALTPEPAVGPGVLCLVLASVLYVVGRSQGVLELDAMSFILMLMACMLLLVGRRGLRLTWFSFFFLLFMVPLPGTLVQMITLPLKQAVSYVAENLLYWAGYPIGRTGVTLTIGPYQLLVADACSGLNSLFTLESLGLLYMNIMNYKSAWRNGILAVFIVPISFIANVTRVITLVLVTYYLGDEVGQSFVHEFAGVLLFSVAMVLIYGVDRLLAAQFDESKGARHGR
ncbi:MAG: exosortase B [Aquabacterium sp.]|uniref:exosortase B n=1 Tax=Aquabacterium sp. TaxID=1872578 RepID=UPI0011F6A578|nr:exosortase B [Aquabacterium sp.]TAK97868.1 MAG: exosortase B [Aquabacterium sp.]